MGNPYRHPEFKKIRRKSRWKYWLALIRKLPAFLVWQVTKHLPDEMLQKMWRRFAVFFMPLSKLLEFFGYWLATRRWKRLFYAIPLILSAVWMYSVIYLANNQTGEELYSEYREDLLRVVAKQKYELADFLAGKVIYHSDFQNDDDLLYAAMIAAHGNGNFLRRDMLMKRLTGERRYFPAYMWHAQLLLSTPNNEGSNVQKAIQQIQFALDEKPDSEQARSMLAQLYFGTNRVNQAIGVINSSDDITPAMKILLARLHFSNKDREQAIFTLQELLDELDASDPERDKYTEDFINACSLSIEFGVQNSEAKNDLLDLVKKLERERSFYQEDHSFDKNIMVCYLGLTLEAIKSDSTEHRINVLKYLEEMLKTDQLPAAFGRLVYNVSNFSSNGGLRDEEVSGALVAGIGVPIAHTLLGLNAWEKNLEDNMRFHLNLAYAHNPLTVKCVEQFALYVGQGTGAKTLSPFRLSLDSRPLWRRAIDLLDIIASIDKNSAKDYLLPKCKILAYHQRWLELAALVEPQFEQFEGEQRITYLQYLCQAYLELGDNRLSQKYQQLLAEAVQDPQD